MEIFPVYLACAASVPVRLSARSRHFSLFGRAKIGATAKNCRFFRPRPNFRAAKKRKMPLEWAGKANGNACYAGYTVKAFFIDILMHRQMRSLINQNLNWRQCKLPFIVSLPCSVEPSENKMGEKKWNIKTGNLINNVLTKSQFGITKRRFEINAVYIYSSLNPLLWPSVRSAAALRNVDENSFLSRASLYSNMAHYNFKKITVVPSAKVSF